MKKSRLGSCVLVVGLVLAACDDATDANLVSDATVNQDVAVSSGDAIAVAVSTMLSSETDANLSGAGGSGSNVTDGSVNIVFTRKCYDGSDNLMQPCTPVADVRKIATHVTIDGTRSGSNEGETKTWTGAVHRAGDDTLTRVFVTGTETSRVHVATGTANDTLTVTEGTSVRQVSESAIDSVKALTWNLPHASNPWPASGSIVRRVHVKVSVTTDTRTSLRDVTRRVSVTFPADAQGNVVLTISGALSTQTCNLNLVTHAVTNCQN